MEVEITRTRLHLDAGRRTRVERAVAELHEQLPRRECGRLVLPVDVVAFARDVAGLRVIVAPDGITGVFTENRTGEPISGMLDPARRRIYVDGRDAPRRQRFTIAHECAHHLLGHAELYRGSAHVEMGRRTEGEAPRVGESADELARERALAELEADRFAGLLLIPPDELDELAAEHGADVSTLASRFDVSGPAMRLHLARYQHPVPEHEVLG